MKLRTKHMALLAAVLVMSQVVAFAAPFVDMPDNWAKAPLERAVEHRILGGYQGKIMPFSHVTRAELVQIVANMLQLEKAGEVPYEDISDKAWYRAAVAQLTAEGILQPDSKQFSADVEVTREEVFALVSRAFKLGAADDVSLSTFKDGAQIASKNRRVLAGLVEGKYVVGYQGHLNPQGRITRAELAAVLDNIVPNYIDQPGTYTRLRPGNVLVRCEGVTLPEGAVKGVVFVKSGIPMETVKLSNASKANLVALDRRVGIDEEAVALGKSKPSSVPSSSAPSPVSGGGGSGSGSAGTPVDTGNSGGGGTPGPGNTPGTGTEAPTTWIDVEKTGVVDLGYASYLVVVFKEGTAEDYALTVDRDFVTPSKVNDSGSIVKWEVKRLHHKKLTVERLSDHSVITFDLVNKTLVQ